MFADFALIQRAMNIERNMQDRAKPSDSGSSEQESVDKEDSGAVANSVVAARSRFRVSASDETHSDADGDESDNNSNNLQALKRPRKKVYKSTLMKRNREKERRDHFNGGLERLAGKIIKWATMLTINEKSLNFVLFTTYPELVFQVDPSISSGRDNHMGAGGKSTTITNRGELMQSAVDAMTRLIREHAEQRAVISKLKEALADAFAQHELLLTERSNSLAEATPNVGLQSGNLARLHNPLSLIDSSTTDSFRRFAGTNIGLVQQGINFNNSLINGRSTTGLVPSRIRTLDAMLSSTGLGSTGGNMNPDSSLAASLLADRGGDQNSNLLARSSLLLPQQFRYPHFPSAATTAASVNSTRADPVRSQMQPDMSTSTTLHELFRAASGTSIGGQDDSRITGALMQEQRGVSSSNKKKRRKTVSDATSRSR